MAYRILVPLDGSEVSELAIPWADAFAEALGAEVELVQVVSTHGDADAGRVEAATETNELLRARALLRHAMKVDAVAVHGSAAEAIVARARFSEATMIVMASHGRGGLARAVQGSVTDDVIARSATPVLVVRADAHTEVRVPDRVLVPLDTSQLARSAFRWVLPLARELGWTLILMAVADMPPQTIPVQGAAIPVPSAGRIHTPAELTEYLEEFATSLRESGLSVETQVEIGDSAREIAQVAGEAQAGLIAMSTHGRRGLDRWFSGSVTDGVIRASPVPVLTLHVEEAAG